jgi:hypothetical protein
MALRMAEQEDGRSCCLTFELSGRRRQDASDRPEKMDGVPQAGRWWPAVGAPFERGVRHHWAVAAHDGVRGIPALRWEARW